MMSISKAIAIQAKARVDPSVYNQQEILENLMERVLTLEARLRNFEQVAATQTDPLRFADEFRRALKGG